MTRNPPRGYRDNPIWLAFELWADEHYIAEDEGDFGPWWECFLTGYEIGLAEAA